MERKQYIEVTENHKNIFHWNQTKLSSYQLFTTAQKEQKQTNK